jgi:hypothetical protein
MSDYEIPPKFEAPPRSQSVMDDPFYKSVRGLKPEENHAETAETQATVDEPSKYVVAKNPLNGLKMKSTEQEVLDNIHQMRLMMFEHRSNDPNNEKPYLPMLSSDEKELIMEQYFASKKKLNKV